MKRASLFNNILHGTFCLAVIALLAGCAPNSRTIRDNIFSAIDSQPNFGPHQITVDARNGVVTLTGQVSSEQDRMYVYNAARRQPGVVDVRDELHIFGPNAGPYARMAPSLTEPAYVSAADRDLVLAIEQNLLPLSSSHNYRVNIISRDGFVTISGTAGSRADADAVIQAARATSGVRNVTDRIDIAPAPSDLQVRNALQSAFTADREARLQGVNYEVQNGVVTFTGRVNNHRDIDRLLSIALMTPGVRGVRSNVTILK